MIWSITSKKEMEELNKPSVFRFYQEALGRENIQLAVVDEDDNLNFINKGDIVLLRTASESLINTIRKKEVRTTAEDYDKYELAWNKKEMGIFLRNHGVNIPRTFQTSEIVKGRVYIVKPMNSCDSFGISKESICFTKEDVYKQCSKVLTTTGCEAIVEEYIHGREFTVAVVNNTQLSTFAAEAIFDRKVGIQTYELKKNREIVFQKVEDNIMKKDLCDIAAKVFKELKLKSHARIDFRCDKYYNNYVIDVNLIPGLGPLEYLPRVMQVSDNISYIDALKAVIASAS